MKRPSDLMIDRLTEQGFKVTAQGTRPVQYTIWNCAFQKVFTGTYAECKAWLEGYKTAIRKHAQYHIIGG